MRHANELHDPNAPAADETVVRTSRKRRADKDRELAQQVRRTRIDEALAARERAILTEYRSEAAS